MVNSNVIIQEFIANNWMAITILINLLQGIAWLTPSVKDDKVVTLISQTFESIRNFKSLSKKEKDVKP